MAKVQGKKGASGVKKSAGKKPVARRAARKVVVAAKKAVRRVVAAPKKKTAPAKPPKPAARPKAKAKAAPPRKPEPKAVAARPVAARPVAAPPKPAPAAVEKKRTRRSRPKLSSSGPPTAAWFSQGEKPRPSSFIPAPPRAEAPSLIAAPPASSDRLVSNHELTEFVVRTVPVRIDVEAGGGRVFLSIYPDDVTLRVGEGIEWDFRYLGGADVTIDEIIVEFEKPSPFSTTTYKSRRPGTARPHRQLSGAAQKSAAGKRFRYTIRAMNAFKSEMATAKPNIAITA
jgi:hypothetical protein